MTRILIVLLAVITALIASPTLAVNRVLSLDGDGDYVEVPDADSLDLTDNFTFEAWVFLTVPAVVNNMIFNKEQTYEWAIVGGNLQWALKTGGAWDWYDTGISVPLNQWTHFALTYDSKNVSVYGNGVLLSTIVNQQGGNLKVNDSVLRIGARSALSWGQLSGAYEFFTGLMDEVRIWNVVRTTEEIQSTMHTTLKGKEHGLVGYWRFDDDENTATDSSPNNSDGKLIGDAHFVEAELPRLGELVMPTALSGIITDEAGQSISNTSVRLERNREEIMQTQTDVSGNYRIVIFHSGRGLYNLSAIRGELGDWQLGIRLREGERQKLNLKLKEAISIEGILLMLDDKTPHVAVPVQAIRDGKVIDGILSDEDGKYRFINLKPGVYQVRCQIRDGYVYYGQVREAIPRIGEGKEQKSKTQFGKRLQVSKEKALLDIDFRFPPFKKGTWKTYTYLDGLANNLVHDIYSDADGVMWFGTRGGVSRYDGEKFTNFTIEDGLAHNEVFAIYGHLDGMLWFGTRGGVSRYDGKKFVNFTIEDGLAHNEVFAIYGHLDGMLWFGTGGGVSRYDGEKFTNFTTEDGLAANTVFSIYRTPDGVIWFGTGVGVSRYDGNQFVNLTIEGGLQSRFVHAIDSDSDMGMWFGTRRGLFRYNGQKFVEFTTKDGLANNVVRTIYRASDGVLCLGTVGGVSQYDGKRFLNFTQKDGLANNFVLSMYRAPDGTMWFGTVGGVSQYDDKGFLNFTTKDELAHNKVNAIYQTPNNVLWFGTNNGVSQYDGKRFLNFTQKDGLANNLVLSIHCDFEENIWFGTWNAGISRYDGNQFRNFSIKDGLSDVILSIHYDLDGNMWFGTLDAGLFRYDGKEFVNFTTKDGLAGMSVSAIHQEPNGALWFGTLNSGISRYYGNQFKNFTIEDGLAGNLIHDIYRAPNGTIWFGTVGGVSRYDGKKFKNFTQKDGWTHAGEVTAIHCDVNGTMWFATNGGGLSRYDSSTWTSLDTRDGLAGNNVSSICQDKDGFLWFGTDSGITRYRPSKTKPKIHLVSVKTDKEYTADNHRGVSLQAISPITTGNRITIKYSAIDFKTVPEKRMYRYRIKEIDDDWRPPTKDTFFDNSFDKPGEYTFEVQAIDRDLNYSEPASVTLKVVLPFYMRASFLVPTLGFGTILLTISIILATAFVKHRRRISAYQRVAVQELQDANEMQMSLMPETAPEIEGVEIAGKCIPANTVSGDFFDYLEGKHPNEIGLVIADVSGKAMKGAMNAVMTDGILRASAQEIDRFSPASLMMKVNNVLKDRMEQYMNVTMVIGKIDAAPNSAKNDARLRLSGEFGYTLTIANAAHHAYPLLLREGEIQILKGGGLPLGMRAGVEYTEEQIPLQIGDVLFLMTDGIIEAQNSEGQMYSDSGRLDETISKFTLALSAEAMVEAIINDAIDFGGDKTMRDDDMTVVVAKILN